MLFPYSQASLVLLILCNAVIIALWTADSGRFDLRTAFPLLISSLLIALLLVAGLPRANADNTYYVSLRQCAAMLQLILCGWLLCYPFCPKSIESER